MACGIQASYLFLCPSGFAFDYIFPSFEGNIWRGQLEGAAPVIVITEKIFLMCKFTAEFRFSGNLAHRILDLKSGLLILPFPHPQCFCLLIEWYIKQGSMKSELFLLCSYLDLLTLSLQEKGEEAFVTTGVQTDQKCLSWQKDENLPNCASTLNPVPSVGMWVCELICKIKNKLAIHRLWSHYHKLPGISVKFQIHVKHQHGHT